ncbi:hypothetical protein [Hymenobacter seoulensis]
MQIALPDPKASAGSAEAFPTLKQLEAFGAWQDLTVMGNVWSDYFDVRMVESSCLSLTKEQTQGRALRVFVAESTTYNTFIQLLDIAHRLDIRRHWLDLRRPPYTFNLLGNEPRDLRYSFVCGNGYYQSQTDLKPWRPFSDKVAEWFIDRSTDLLTPEWRNTTLLLLLITLLSIWRLGRQ